jgi:hypothetical protein
MQVADAIIRYIDEINRPEWIIWEWVECTEFWEEKRKYIRGIMRPIEDAPKAAEQFDIWIKAYKP